MIGKKYMPAFHYRVRPDTLLLTCVSAVMLFVWSAGIVSASELSFQPHGFVEFAAGARFGDELPEKEHASLLEQRLQFKFSYFPRKPSLLAQWYTVVFFKAEALIDLHREEPDSALREFYLQISPLQFMDLKLGRQILTWGTGDLIFINDLFPKDYVSFFIGRDVEYLKEPSDALRLSFYSDLANLDFVWIPFFEPDTPIRGRRLSFYNPFIRDRDGEEATFYFNKPGRSISNSEIALRIHRMFGRYELALYVFRGFYKQPVEMIDMNRREVTYPELAAYGASIRGPAIDGIVSLEAGYYHSREDSSGHDPFVENSSCRYLAAYERQFEGDLTVSFQYFVRQLLDYNDYSVSLPRGSHQKDEFRHLLTTRITKLVYNQDIELSLFIFYSPSDSDYHIRPRVTWDVTDTWKLTCGANLFGGTGDYTQFGQLKGNNMMYMRMQYSY